jgi:class 3 adenylate cyclase
VTGSWQPSMDPLGRSEAPRQSQDAVRPLATEVRCGLHTGEIEIIDSHVAGLAVHIGARIAALAAPGEVLVSRTVKDLVAGAGFQFTAPGVFHQRRTGEMGGLRPLVSLRLDSISHGPSGFITHRPIHLLR